MAIRKKSVKVPVNFGNIANIADGISTTLGTPVIYVPENNVSTPVTFSAAMLFVAQQSSGSTTQTFTMAATCSLSVVGVENSVLINGTSGQTGEDSSGIVGPIDFTDYFSANFGTAPSSSCTVSVNINTSAGTTVGAYAWLELSYTYDDTVAKRIQTICVPYESSGSTLATTARTYATLKQLTGAGGILSGYATPSIRHRWLEVKGNTNLLTSATDISMSYNFDGGATQLLPPKENGGAFGNWVYYQVDSSGVTSNATHSFQLWNSIAARWANIVVNEWVSFEYTASGTNSCLNFIELPIDIAYPIGTSEASASLFVRDLYIPEPNPVLIKGAIEFQYNSVASVTMAVKAGEQTLYNAYTQSSDAVAGQFTFNHGLDSDSLSGNAFASFLQGINDITVYSYAPSGSVGSIPTNISGIIRLLYSSSVSPSGIDSHTHTFYSMGRQMDLNPVTESLVLDSITIPEENYWLTETAMQYYMFISASNATFGVDAQVLGFDSSSISVSNRYVELFRDSYISDNENSFGGWVVRNRPNFKRYPLDPDPGRLNIEYDRYYKTRTSTGARYGFKFFTTYHTITGSLTGSLTNRIGPAFGTSLDKLDVFKLSPAVVAGDFENAELFYSLDIGPESTPTYNFSIPVYDFVSKYYVVAYEQSGLQKGVTTVTYPTSASFNIDLAPAAGSGEFYF